MAITLPRKAVLRLYGFDALAREIKRNFPFSNRVRRQIDALTCAYGTEWEADLAHNCSINGHFTRVGRQARKERHAQEICGPALVIFGFGLFLTLATLIPA